jgi:hypothetical protein
MVIIEWDRSHVKARGDADHKNTENDRSHSEGTGSDVDHRFGCIFYGRYAANVNTFRAFGDRMPSTSGDAVEIQFVGAKMSQERNRPVRQRYPVVGAKMRWDVVQTPRQVAT